MSQDAATRKRAQREAWRVKREEAHRVAEAAPPEDRTWREHAACAGQDPAEWVIDNEDQPGARAKIAAAKLTCQTCPVAHFCLVWALTQPATSIVGVFGGTTSRDRQRIRRRRNLGGDDPDSTL